MPHFMIYIKANLQHVQSFRPSENARYCLTLTSGDDERENIWLDPKIKEEAPGGRSETNLIIRFEGAKKPATVDFIGGDIIAEYTENDSGQWVAIQAFECRGCEITKYSPQDDWIVIGESGQEFVEEIMLSDDWCDYDEGADVSPEITDLEMKVERYNPVKKGGKKAKAGKRK